MQKTQKTSLPTWSIVRRLFRLAGGQRSWFYLALGLDLLLAALVILSNDFTRRVFEAVTVKDTAAFMFFFWLTLGSTVTNIPLSYLKVLGIGQFSERTLAILRQTVAARSTGLAVETLEARHSGDLLSVLNADLGKLKTMLGTSLLDVVGHSVRGIAALAYIISINWVLALVSTILTPLIFVAISALTNPLAKRSEEMQEEIGQVNSVAQDALSGALVVKAFNLVELLDGLFHKANGQALKKGLLMAHYKALIDGVTLPMAIVPFIIAIGLGGYYVIQGQITFGALFTFINLLNYVVNPLASIPGSLAAISEAAGAGVRVFELIDTPVERSDGLAFPDGAGNAEKSGEAFEFDGLTFAYAGEETPVLKKISVAVPRGETVAVVGPSGGGKSTLVKLLLGYYPVADGSLRLFGEDLNRWKLAAAREQMAFVAQDTYLFPISLGENIRLGKPGASQVQIERAAKMANIHDFISSLPEGYNTNAGEWGSRLSGGQRQRISLARAILKDAPILLLDEPTSALDTESEALVQQALERFSQGRTTLVIAHRLSTIKNANRVLVLDEGEIVEQGTHEALIAHGGVYLDLYQRQFALDQPNGSN